VPYLGRDATKSRNATYPCIFLFLESA
jgi:hypothetical protein